MEDGDQKKSKGSFENIAILFFLFPRCLSHYFVFCSSLPVESVMESLRIKTNDDFLLDP